MTTFITFAILGIGTGTAYALLAQGVLLVYRGTGTINFSHGALAMTGAFLFWQFDVRSGLPFGVAFVLTIAICALLGLVIYQLFMRPLGRAGGLSRIIVTLGLLVLLPGVAQVVWGVTPINVSSWLPTHLYKIGSVQIGENTIILLAIAIGLTAFLWFASSYWSLGLAIRANAENSRAVSALGWSVNALGGVTWSVGAALAGIAGVFIAPFIGIDTANMPLLIIPVLAAVLIGALTSFWFTFWGAMAIGIAQSLVANYVRNVPGIIEATPFIIIVALLFVRRQGLPTRTQGAQRLPALGAGRIRPLLLIPVAVAAYLLMEFVFSENLTIALGTTFGWAVILLSVVVLVGYAGQLSLAQFALGGIAAFVAGRLVAEHDASFVVASLTAIVATVGVGMVFAIPALRARGVNLAIVTLGLSVGVTALLFTNGSLTGGVNGTIIGAQSLFGIDLDTILYPRRWALLGLVMLLICGLLVANVRRGTSGRRMIAVRTNERAAAALGIDVMGVKMFAFAFAAALAAVGGILVAFQTSVIVYSQFDPSLSIMAVGYAFIGGIGLIFGAPIGATLAVGGFGAWLINVIVPNANPAWLTVLSGAFLIGLALLHQDGIVHTQLAVVYRLVPWLRSAPRAAVADSGATSKGLVVPERVLEVDDVVVRFGGVTAVAGATLAVSPGEVVGLIGPNGAGKTTLIDVITGFVEPAAGTVRLDGERIDRLSVHRRMRAGVGRSFQSLELFESSTVRENLSVASDSWSISRYLTDFVKPRTAEISPYAMRAVEELGLTDDLEIRVSDLPYGKRRLVAIARSVARGPSVLLLDEPAAGLSSTETMELADVIRRLTSDMGFGVLVVEHDMAFVMGICDKVVVLNFGEQIAQGTPDTVRSDSTVITAYLGESQREAAADIKSSTVAYRGRPASGLGGES
jgi:ABC-type branched-subunit amino acid transport system ATPase component/branched-subunit amino acid ABC-type transport system permease component